MYRTVLFIKKITMKTFLITIGILSFCISKTQTLNESDLMNYISSNSVDLNYSQIIQSGNQNLAYIDGNNIGVTQNGDNQSFYYTETSINASNLQVNMDGSNNYVEVFGNNQISENMTITLTGDDKTIIIRNYP